MLIRRIEREGALAVAAEAAEQLAIMVAGRVALETTAQALLADEPAQSRGFGSRSRRGVR